MISLPIRVSNLLPKTTAVNKTRMYVSSESFYNESFVLCRTYSGITRRLTRIKTLLFDFSLSDRLETETWWCR